MLLLIGELYDIYIVVECIEIAFKHYWLSCMYTTLKNSNLFIFFI